MNGLAALRQEPGYTPEAEKVLPVSTIPVENGSVRLSVTGYGQAAVVNTIKIAPHVSGHIIIKYPALEQGGW